ncbi:2-oxoglutarate dehydrogenase E1 component [Aneurinibacillus sp. Ricciae_BoGa-3]|nr:2-oxoglutarate dehydrogenase E1 component [Aneurinibacillus sp. Ricciae_BoGa-3]WCK56915.1 2-oxoglutarate dehydrogenase E1 component [Aneurinibacillus sp. Ricciae_BoGa-3]
MGSNTPWQDLSGPNLGYVQQLYEQYLEDPQTVDEQMRALFERWGAPTLPQKEPYAIASQETLDMLGIMKKAVSAVKLIQNVRINGHLAARTNSFSENKEHLFSIANYGLTREDLESIPAKIAWSKAPDEFRTAWDVIEYLRQVYIGSTAYQFTHVNNVEERHWLNHRVATLPLKTSMSREKQLALLRNLIQADEFEQFLHRTFVGQKRFSLEGLEVLVPMMDELIRQGAHDGVRHVLIGMAHRGRLNVLAHILGKPYEKIFSEFHHSPNKELVPSEGSMGINYGWSGDVKYHLGADREIQEDNAARIRLTLANNPSHLEFVDPVVEGFTRASQEDRKVAGQPVQDTTKALAILIHGDAAFPGEGVVAETLNLSRLKGYHTGGTIHIIANNQIGFTTESGDSRSTLYASDLAKGFEIPIVHVNADDPEACLQAISLAYEYRKTFKKDFLIDLMGYRRYGHNEMDDPNVTQPLLYEKVSKHPRIPVLYADKLKGNGVISEQDAASIRQDVQNQLKNAYEQVKTDQKEEHVPYHLDKDEDEFNIKTSVPAAKLAQLNKELLTWPQEFSVYPKLEKILKRREQALETSIDWAHAETLAFATILADGTPIRMTGQDIERGTFAQRHVVLHDYKTGKTFTPLQHLKDAKASYAVYNSPLSEASVLAFEYGYDVLAKNTLVLWEAQFGDFANAAQVHIDTFLAPGRAKWGQKSSLVMLLPHGYEGQGAEHSSARLERFLQLSGSQNWTIANLTSAAQYFHILRWQASRVGREEARPLILMTPKSLLRNPRASSRLSELSESAFKPLLEQPGLEAHAATAERLILCSGKVAIDLEAEWEALNVNNEKIHMVRVEQLYPLPSKAIRELLSRCTQLKEIAWVQEEPKNMGAWSYIEPKLRELGSVHVRYIGRPVRSSPAEGSPDVHKVEQQRILREALFLTEMNTGNPGGDNRE